MGQTKKLTLRRGEVFTNAPVPFGALWLTLCELEDSLAERLMLMAPGSRAVADGLGWTLRERSGQLELFCGRLDGRRLADARSRFQVSLEWVDIDEDQLQAQISALQTALLTLVAP